MDTEPNAGVGAKGGRIAKAGPIVVGRGAYGGGSGGVGREHAIPDRLLDERLGISTVQKRDIRVGGRCSRAGVKKDTGGM